MKAYQTIHVATFEGNLTGNVTGTVSSISNHSTSDLSEGTNLYYTDARFDTRLGTKTTDNLTEGSSNLYMTTERVQDIAGGMVTGNTETGITVTYDDTDGTLDFVVGTLNQDTTGNAATATALETARTIGGVSFDGTGNIDLAGVNTTGNQDTSGNAATATALATGRTIGMTGDVVWTSASFDGSGNVTGTATIQANSVALGTDTTGDYVSTITGGTGITSTGATSGEGIAHSLSVDASQTQITSVGALDAGSITSGFGSIDVGSSAITTSGTVTGGTLAGTLSTAAQTNITSVGTLTGFTSTGIDDNADATAITIDSSENVTFTGGLVIPSTITHAGDTDTKLDFNQANTLRLITGDNTAWICSASSMVINEDSIDFDFRVESNNNANMLFVDGGNDRVGIGTSSPSHQLEIESSSDADLLQVQSTAGSNDTALRLGIDGDVATINATGGSTGILGIKTYGTERMRIDSSGNVGIGGTSGGERLLLTGGATAGARLKFTQSTASLSGQIQQGSSGFGIAALGSQAMLFDTNGSERMRLDSSGQLGIGTSSPSVILHTSTSSDNVGRFESTDATAYIQINDTADSFYLATGSQIGSIGGNAGVNANNLNIDLTNGNVGIGTASPATGLSLVGANNTASTLTLTNTAPSPDNTWTFTPQYNSGDLTISDDGSERMRIDSAGAIQIGGTTNAGFVDFDSTSLQLNSQRNPNTGSFVNTAKSHASIALRGADGGSEIRFGTASANNTASTERMRINSTGQVLVGKTSGTAGNAIEVNNRISAAAGSASQPTFNCEGDTNTGINLPESDRITLVTGGSERARFDASGNFLVGKSSTTFSVDGFIARSDGFSTSRTSGTVADINRNGTDGNVFAFYKAASSVGSISVTSSATAYNTSSDARLKDVTGEARGLEVINKLNPVAYNWKESGQADEGLIAQEVLDIVPNAVSGSEEEMYQMDYSKLVVHLVKGMKEQQEQIDALQSEINLLKGE